MPKMRFLACATAAALTVLAASTASAQPADPFAYQSPGEQILQGVIDSLLGNRYTITDRRAVRRCANAALAEAWDEFGPRRRLRDRRGWRDRPQMRIAAITDVERRPAGLRVRGLIDSGLLFAQPFPNQSSQGDLRFRCNIDYNGRLYNVRVDRNPKFRPPLPR